MGKKIVIPQSKLSSKIERFGKKYQFMVKPVCILTIIYSIALTAIIRADYNYIDDLGRVAFGYKQWTYFSRYTSEFLSGLIHADRHLSDISPFPQLLAVFVLSIASVIVLYMISEKEIFSLGRVIAVLPLGLCPYFLECLSYKYDSPYMALSILASVFPLLLFEYGSYCYGIATFFSILVMCTTYQAASGIFPMFVVILCFKWWTQGKEIKKIAEFLMISILGYVGAIGFFRWFIMSPIDDYVSSSVVSIGEMISQWLRYYSLIGSDFKKWWLWLIAFLAVSFIYVVVRDSATKKYYALLGAVATILACAGLTFGVYPLLKNPLYSPRAMYGFGAFIAFMSVFIADAKKWYPGKIACWCLSYVFFIFAFTYGNALSEQWRYTDFRVEAVIDDLNDLESFTVEGEKFVQLSGTIGKSPIFNNVPQDYQILNRLVPDTFGDGWMWSKYYFFNYFGLENVFEASDVDLTTYNLPILKSTKYHTIRGKDGYFLVEIIEIK